jgi:hypothetical protein
MLLAHSALFYIVYYWFTGCFVHSIYCCGNVQVLLNTLSSLIIFLDTDYQQITFFPMYNNVVTVLKFYLERLKVAAKTDFLLCQNYAFGNMQTKIFTCSLSKWNIIWRFIIHLMLINISCDNHQGLYNCFN